MKAPIAAIGCLALAGHMVLFTAGIANASPLIATISLKPGYVTAFFAVILIYTPLNIGFLAIFAGLLGGRASRIAFAGLSSLGDPAGPAAADSIHPHRTESPFASMFRGLLVYLAVIAGMHVIADDPFQKPTPQQYVQLASTVSLFAFVVGYDPTKFREWIQRVPKPGGAQ